MPELQTAGQSIVGSFQTALSSFFGFIPSLLGAVVVLAVGWWVSGWVARLIEKGLFALGLERAVSHTGINQFLTNAGTQWNTTQMIGVLSKWFIRLIFIQAAANILGMPQLTQIINSILLFIPNLIVSMVILIVGAMLSRVLSRAVRASTAQSKVGNPNFLATLTQYAVLGFAIIAALNQVGIAAMIVNTLLIGLVAALSLAIGLAFGLGGKDSASRVTAQWLQKNQGPFGAANRPTEVSKTEILREEELKKGA
jgi:hypothetical protein